MAEYRLSPAAEQDLENIWHYTNEQWGVEQHVIYFQVSSYCIAIIRVL